MLPFFKEGLRLKCPVTLVHQKLNGLLLSVCNNNINVTILVEITGTATV